MTAQETMRSVAGGLRSSVRGCRDHEPDHGALADALLSGWAEALERASSEVDGNAQAAEIARLKTELQSARVETAKVTQAAREEHALVAGLKAKIKEQGEQIKSAHDLLGELQAKLLKREPVEQLVSALRVLCVVMCGLRFVEDKEDRSRRMVVGAMELAQDAMKAAGQIGDFPAGRVAGELALERYRQDLFKENSNVRDRRCVK